MIRSLMVGLVAGQRGMTPLAAVALGTRRGRLAPEVPLQSLMLNPVIAAGAAAAAAAEMVGDKQKTAPDRIVPIGLVVRSITAAFAGAAVAGPSERGSGAVVALASSWFGWRLRCAAMERYGQTATGFAEEAVVFGAAIAITNPDLLTRAK